MLFVPLPLRQLSNVCWGGICLDETPHLCRENKGLANTYRKPWEDSVRGAVPLQSLLMADRALC